LVLPDLSGEEGEKGPCDCYNKNSIKKQRLTQAKNGKVTLKIPDSLRSEMLTNLINSLTLE
jgi:hypothetical protein